MDNTLIVDAQLSHWIIFNIVILFLLACDLFYSRRNPGPMSFKRATFAMCGWVGLAVCFNIWILLIFGHQAALAFFVSYMVEESLSVDNLFLFAIIFSYFKVPEDSKHDVLFFGILGAIVMRAGLIWGGLTLLSTFHWVHYLFGVFLIYGGIKLLFPRKEIQKEENFLYKLLTKVIPILNEYRGKAFFVYQDGRWVGTLLLLVLFFVEVTDLIFALDSVTAVLGITTDPFIVYTSNISAILGLRALYFVFEGAVKRFYLLPYALATILIFIGCKMLFADWITIRIEYSLLIILAFLGIAIVGSLYRK